MGVLSDAFRFEFFAKLLLSILLGGAIGIERQMSEKPAGLRTNILICLGSAMLMDLSMNLPGANGVRGDPARLAAQVITGIGFLGAGTILHSPGGITGLTTAATIWVVAALGLTVGAGHLVEACGATALVMTVLKGLGAVEHKLLRAQRVVNGTLRVKSGTPFEEITKVFRTDGVAVLSHQKYDHAEDRVFEVRLRAPALQYEVVAEALLRHPEILGVHLDGVTHRVVTHPSVAGPKPDE